MVLKGKNAIVTGSNQGLGKAIAEEFIRGGANVIICARNTELLYETEKYLSNLLTNKQKLYAFYLDISNKNDIIDFYDDVIHRFKSIDILVNNAGIYGAKGLLEDTDIDEWIETINVNLIGTVRLTKLFIPKFKLQRSGKIINLSGNGAVSPRPYFSAYATSKAAIVRFSECIAEELKEYNVDVNCVAPGALNTKMLDEAIISGAEKVGEEYYKRALKQKENGGASLKNAAELVTFLASDKSNTITGRLISAVWDNWKTLSEHKQELKNTDIYTLRRILPFDVDPYWMEEK